MYAAPECGGPFKAVEEYPNAWGSAAYVWSAISAKLFGSESYWLTAVARDDHKSKEFWDSWKDPRLSEVEKITFMFTFDAALVRREHFRRLATIFREFVKLHPAPGRACSLPKQADRLDILASEQHGLDFTPAFVGWQQTSVSENPWRVRTGEDEGRSYDVSKDSKHFFLFDEVI